MARITAGACRRYAAEAGRAPATVRRELGTLAAAMNWCVTEGRLTQGGIVVLPPVPKDEQPFLTRSQAAGLLLEARCRRWRWKDAGGRLHTNLHLPLFILVGLYHGARKEAILKLQKRRARVPIAARLVPWLRIARKITRQFVIECDGKPVGDVKKGFAAAAAAVNLPEVHPHTLRHTCVTWLLRDGLDVWQVGGFLGMSPQTIQQVYGHHAPEFMAEAATSRRGRAETGLHTGIKTIRA